MATSNKEWLQIYQNNLTGTAQPTTVVRWSDDFTTEATTVTTTTTSTTTSSASNHLSRVTRPINPRRRSRASRKTPTTLLNTDTTNFRAMVQQFTGVGGGGGSMSFPAATATVSPRQPLSSCYNTNSTGFNHYPAGGGYNLESLPQQQRYYTMAADNGGAASGQIGGDHQHGFFQRLQEEGIGGSNKTANFY